MRLQPGNNTGRAAPTGGRAPRTGSVRHHVDWEAEGLLDDLPDDRAREARRKLLDELREDGVSLEELRRAVAEQRLALLPVERLLGSGQRYSHREIAEESGLELA